MACWISSRTRASRWSKSALRSLRSTLVPFLVNSASTPAAVNLDTHSPGEAARSRTDKVLLGSEGQHIKETRRHLVGDQHSNVVIRGITSSFIVPVFNASDDMAWIGRAELYFHFIPCLVLIVGIRQQDVEPPATRLKALAIFRD